MSLCIDTEDPRGIRIICTDYCWTNHILNEHPDMAGFEGDVAEAIRRPNPPFVFQDKDRDDRQIYYCRLKNRWAYIKVIVEFSDKYNEGEIITAFLADSPKKGEKMIWPSSRG